MIWLTKVYDATIITHVSWSGAATGDKKSRAHLQPLDDPVRLWWFTTLVVKPCRCLSGGTEVYHAREILSRDLRFDLRFGYASLLEAPSRTTVR
jgi:hypothetical protein